MATLLDRLQKQYNPDQPRVPAGNSAGGQFASTGGSGVRAEAGYGDVGQRDKGVPGRKSRASAALARAVTSLMNNAEIEGAGGRDRSEKVIGAMVNRLRTRLGSTASEIKAAHKKGNTAHKRVAREAARDVESGDISDWEYDGIVRETAPIARLDAHSSP